MLAKAMAVGAAVMMAGCSVVGVRSGTEEAPFDVIANLDDQTEIRRYGQRLAVQTVVEGEDTSKARSEAFSRLFNYISGDNRPNSEVAMTVPVETAPSGGEKIAMTAPVETAPIEDAGENGEEIAMTAPVETSDEEGMRMRFFLPSSFTPETAPEPTDPRVQLATVPGQTLAVRRYSGSTDQAGVGRETDKLYRALERSDWAPTGDSFAYFYDPPWTLPPLRRNEVAVPVEPR